MRGETGAASREGDKDFHPKAAARPSAAAASKAAETDAEIVTVRPDEAVMTMQRLPYFVGIGQATAGATAISMSLVVIPPGAAAEPHVHKGFETAIYVLEGRVETRYGRRLAKTLINQTGDSSRPTCRISRSI